MSLKSEYFVKKAGNDDVINYVINTASNQTTFSSVTQWFHDPQVSHEEVNSSSNLECNIDIKIKAAIDYK